MHCMCVCLYSYVCRCRCMCPCGSQRPVLLCILLCDTASLAERGAHWLFNESQGSSHLCLLITRDCATMLHCLTQGSNSGPHACTIHTLLTEQSPQTCNNPLCMGSCCIRVKQSTWAEEFKINVYFWRFCIICRFGGPLLFHKKTLLIEGTLSLQATLTWEGNREAHVPLMTMACHNCWILGWAVNLITVCHVLLNWSPIEQ